MKGKKISSFILFLVAFCTLFTVYAAGPDLLVKVIKDDLARSKKCTLGVVKNGSFKSLDDKYKVMTYDLYILNNRGETKWWRQMRGQEIDLSSEEELEIVKGDLVVIDNISLIHIKSGEELKIKRITDRYLVR